MSNATTIDLSGIDADEFLGIDTSFDRANRLEAINELVATATNGRAKLEQSVLVFGEVRVWAAVVDGDYLRRTASDEVRTFANAQSAANAVTEAITS